MLECPPCAAGSTGHCNTARSLSAGVSKPKVFRGREILSQQAVGVLVAAALPRTAWIAEIDLHVGGDGEVLVVSHLLASIPGQRATQLLGQFAHVFTERGYYGRRVLARDFEKHHKARMALD